MKSILPAQSETSDINLFIYSKYAPAFLFLAISSIPLIVFGDDYAIQRITDDAYYYIVIGRNLIDIGESSFLQGFPTNGYHPLWLILITLTGSIFGFSLTVIKFLELAVIFAGLVIFIRFFKIQTLLETAFYTFFLWYIFRSFSLVAMETSLLFPALVFFFVSILSEENFFASNRWLVITISSCLVIGTRLDAAFFVIPILFIVPVSRKEKQFVFLSLLAVASIYAGFNHLVFGTPVPVSGSVKTLGGLQLNTHYINQVIHGFTFKNIISIGAAGTPWIFAYFALLAALVIRKNKSNLVVYSVIMAALAGMILYGAKLLFGSSWAIWNWYGYPVMIFTLPIIWLTSKISNGRLLSIGMVFCTVIFIYEFIESTLYLHPPYGYIEANRQFADNFSDLLAAKTVAMGDRAGSFAYFYSGGVYQTEGLVNESEYLEVLKSDGDLRTHLCNNNIEIFLDYEPFQDDYISMNIEILRSSSTSYVGPHIKVYQTEEIARYSDQSIFGRPKGANWDDHIYAWKLEC